MYIQMECVLGRDLKFYFFKNGKRIREPKYFDPNDCVESAELQEILDTDMNYFEARREKMEQALERYKRRSDEELLYLQLQIADKERTLNELSGETFCANVQDRIAKLYADIAKLNIEKQKIIDGKLQFKGVHGLWKDGSHGDELLNEIVKLQLSLKYLDLYKKKLNLLDPTHNSLPMTERLNKLTPTAKDTLDNYFDAITQVITSPVVTLKQSQEILDEGLPISTINDIVKFRFVNSVSGSEETINPVFIKELEIVIDQNKGIADSLNGVLENIVKGEQVGAPSLVAGSFSISNLKEKGKKALENLKQDIKETVKQGVQEAIDKV